MIFSPALLGRQGCIWWILKQILLIIVFHNCHAERDCPLRSYLCHCVPPPPFLLLCSLFNKTQITTGIVKFTSKIIKSKWRIYGWHFITINPMCLINKVRSPLCFFSSSPSLKLSCSSGMEGEEEGGADVRVAGWLSGTTWVSFFLIYGASWPLPNLPPPFFPECPLSPL